MSIKTVEVTSDDIKQLMDEHNALNPERPIRDDIKSSLKRYAYQGIRPGGFLVALLEDRLFEALGRADSYNRATIFQIVSFIYNDLPSTCWGSPERVRSHCESFSTGGEAS